MGKIYFHCFVCLQTFFTTVVWIEFVKLASLLFLLKLSNLETCHKPQSLIAYIRSVKVKHRRNSKY